MNRFLLRTLSLNFLFLTLCLTKGYAQTEPTTKDAARNFMRSGDWDNAILVLNRGIQADPNDFELKKDLVMAYYYKKDYAKALDKVKPLLDSDEADEMTFQLGGNIYKAMEEVKEADKLYKKGLKQFPKSGPLFSEYGELLWANKDFSAINQWEKGIAADPNFAGNYYNASLYYYYTKDKIWTLLYGEIFVNMEYLTERATEMKKLLLSAYKEKLFNDLDEKKGKKGKDEIGFAKAVQQTFVKQGSVINRGINTETLNMLRTRFVLDWFASYANKYPFRLFDYHQQLIKEGMFEAYNQWLFGTVESLPAFDQWTKTNAAAYAKFTSFQKGRIFKMPVGQHYQVIEEKH